MRLIGTALIILTSVLAATATSEAQSQQDSVPAAAATKTKTKTRGTAKPAKPPAIDPRALGAVRKMNAFLRAQQSFQVDNTTQTDHVLPSGETVRLSSHGDLVVDNPHRLRADVVSDRKERQFFFDGKTFTMNSPRTGYYTTVNLPAQSNNRELASVLESTYGLELPLVDVLELSTGEANLEEITRATYIGPATIDGVEVDHYAFRQPGLDWQVWIQRGNQPVPRRLVLTTTDDPARPEHAIEMTWHLGVKHNDATFAFTPPKDATKVALEKVSTQQPAQQARRVPHHQTSEN